MSEPCPEDNREYLGQFAAGALGDRRFDASALGVDDADSIVYLRNFFTAASVVHNSGHTSTDNEPQQVEKPKLPSDGLTAVSSLYRPPREELVEVRYNYDKRSRTADVVGASMVTVDWINEVTVDPNSLSYEEVDLTAANLTERKDIGHVRGGLSHVLKCFFAPLVYGTLADRVERDQFAQTSPDGLNSSFFKDDKQHTVTAKFDKNNSGIKGKLYFPEDSPIECFYDRSGLTLFESGVSGFSEALPDEKPFFNFELTAGSHGNAVEAYLANVKKSFSYSQDESTFAVVRYLAGIASGLES